MEKALKKPYDEYCAVVVIIRATAAAVTVILNARARPHSIPRQI